MQLERFSKFPLRSLLYFVLGSAGVWLVLLFGLRPLQASISRLDEEIASNKARLEQQRELAPLYGDFGKSLVKEASDRLPVSSKTRLSLEQVVGIPVQFQKMARVCNLETLSAAPDVKSFTRDRNFMPVDLILKGNFLNLRRFLFDLERLPYLEHLEAIQIQGTGRGEEFRIKAWVAVNPRKSD
jgi:hypothetical protein